MLGFGRRLFSAQPQRIVSDVLLKDRVKKDLLNAMRAKESSKATVLKAMLSELGYAEKAAVNPAKTDADFISVLRKSVKKRTDSIDQFKQAGRNDLVEKELAELEIVKDYIPEEMSPEQVEKELQVIISELGATNMKHMGKVIQEALKRLDTEKAPRSLIAEVAKKCLTK